MLAALVITFLILAVSFLYGWAGVKVLGRIFFNDRDQKVKPTLMVVLGMCILIWVAQVLSLFIPISTAAFLLVMVGAAGIGFIWYRSNPKRGLPSRSWTLPVILLFALIVLSVVENSTHIAANPDSGLYHAQAIRWIETFPVVPGLGNLHTRFAFNSSWLVLNALFSLAFLGGQSFHLVPAALTLTAALDFASGAIAWHRGKNSSANILRTIFLPLIFFILGSQISSPGTDLPVILTFWIILTAWLDPDQDDEPWVLLRKLVICVIAVTLVTVKLSSVPILILVLAFLIQNYKNTGLVIKLAGMGLIILIPWLARNIFLSGYLVYPLPQIDLFQVDWKIPVGIARAEIESIRAWGRDPSEITETVLARPFSAWLRLWFIEKTGNQKIIIVLAALSPVILAAGTFVYQKTKAGIRWLTCSNGIVFGTTAIAAVYWLFTSPDIRFGYGFLLGLIGLAAIPWLAMIENLPTALSRFIRLAIIAGLIAYQGFFLVRSMDSKTIQARLIQPLDYPQLPTEPCPLGEGQVLCAAEEAWTQCWYSPFPCIPLLNEWAEFRGEDLQDGFKPKIN